MEFYQTTISEQSQINDSMLRDSTSPTSNFQRTSKISDNTDWDDIIAGMNKLRRRSKLETSQSKLKIEELETAIRYLREELEMEKATNKHLKETTLRTECRTSNYTPLSNIKTENSKFPIPGMEVCSLLASLDIDDLIQKATENDPLISITQKKNEQANWTVAAQVPLHLDSIRDFKICAFANQTSILTVSDDCLMKLTNIETFHKYRQFQRKRSEVLRINASELICGTSKTSNQSSRTFREHFGPVFTVAFDEKKQRIATGGTEGVVRIWNVPSSDEDFKSTRKPVTFMAHGDNIWCSGFLTKGSDRLFTVSADNSVKIWNLTDDRTASISTMKSGQFAFASVFAFDDNSLFLYNYDVPSVYQWNLQKDTLSLSKEHNERGSIVATDYSLSAGLIAISFSTGRLVFQDLRMAKATNKFKDFDHSLTFAKFIDESTIIAGGGGPGAIFIDLRKNSVLAEITIGASKFDENLLHCEILPGHSQPFVSAADGNIYCLDKVII